MPKDVLLYGHVGEYGATRFFEQIDKISEETPKAEVRIRINTEGGHPDYMIGMLNKLREMKASKGMVDGMAYSAGAYACCLLEDVEAVESAKFVFHRAAYPTWFEANEAMFDDTHKKLIDITNKSLEKVMRAKMDIAKFEKITKHTLEEMFSMDGQLDLILTATEAKKVGLINKIVKVTPDRKKEIEAYVEQVEEQKFQIAAKKFLKSEADVDDDDEPENKPTPEKAKSMTPEEFKAKHPESYAAIVNASMTAERDRAGVWLAYHPIDAKAAIEGAKSDKPMTATQQAEFQVAAMSKTRIKDISADSTGNVETEETPAAGKEAEAAKKAELETFLGKVDLSMGKKPVAVK